MKERKVSKDIAKDINAGNSFIRNCPTLQAQKTDIKANMMMMMMMMMMMINIVYVGCVYCFFRSLIFRTCKNNFTNSI